MAQGSGSIITQDGTVNVPTEGRSSVAFSLSGTWVATVVIEATCDDALWFSANAISPSSTNIFSAVIANIQFVVACGGFTQVRVRASAYTSGTITATWDVGDGSNPITTVVQAPVSTNAPTYSASSIAQLSLDPAGNLRTKGLTSNLAVTATGISGSAVTLTVPNVASQYHYITALEIVAYTTLARVGGAAPVLVTSTNLPGNPVWDFQSVAVIGSSERQFSSFPCAIRSSVVNTVTTVVCPATTSVIWRVNVFYYAAI